MTARPIALLVLLVGCHGAPASQTAATATSGAPVLASHAIVLPGGPGLVRMDYIAYAQATHSLWVPAGNTGRVDVLDTISETIETIEGFATVEMDTPRGRRVVGPSSVALTGGIAFVGSRADNRICAIDATTRAIGGCATLPAMPDGLALVPSTQELWVTLPRAQQLVVLHVEGSTAPTPVATLPMEGQPEGYAVDDANGVFFTNLEDRDLTLAIDVATRAIRASWDPHCSAGGPRGLIFDPERRLLFVACTDGVVTLDVDRGGAVIGRVETGGGVDDLGYWPTRGLLYVASGADTTLRVVRADDDGSLSVIATASTAAGARNAVVDEHGRAFVTDSEGGRIFVVDAPP
jgi:DNA-binding beta-propeller fold protein YncE